MRYLLSLLLLLSSNILSAQENSVSLNQCREAAKTHWPNFKKLQYNEESIALINSELNKNYLPKLSLNASATYQSEVLTFPEAPGMAGLFPTLKKDNYNTELRLSQLIYDGGNISSAKKLQLASNSLEKSIIEVDNYELMKKINQLYFNVLVLKENELILTTTKEELEKNIEILESAFENGMILKSELNNLKAEKIMLEKHIISNNISISNSIKSLSLISGLQLDLESEFILPKNIDQSNSQLPILKSFEAQLKLSEENVNAQSRNKYPKLSLFATGGYGRPGFDMINTDLHPYGIVGVNFSWNFLDWGINSKKREKQQLNAKVIESSRENFLIQNELEIENTKNEISSIEQQIELDKEILELKKEIEKSSWSKFQNGTIRSNDYLKDFNDYKRTELSLRINKIQLINKQIELQHIKGTQY